MDESDVIPAKVSEDIQMGCEYFTTKSDMWLSIFKNNQWNLLSIIWMTHSI